MTVGDVTISRRTSCGVFTSEYSEAQLVAHKLWHIFAVTLCDHVTPKFRSRDQDQLLNIFEVRKYLYTTEMCCHKAYDFLALFLGNHRYHGSAVASLN